jgi:DNA-directed RNA polymerase specialized sigma subunit
MHLNNQTLLDEFHKSKTAGQVTPGLARLFMRLAIQLSNRSNFRGYSYREDMVSEALEHLCRGWKSFDPAKTTNAFGYYTRVAWAAMVRVIKREGRHGQIRDQLLNAAGLRGSAGYELDRETQSNNIDP